VNFSKKKHPTSWRPPCDIQLGGSIRKGEMTKGGRLVSKSVVVTAKKGRGIGTWYCDKS
jgi:hypothetical protein